MSLEAAVSMIIPLKRPPFWLLAAVVALGLPLFLLAVAMQDDRPAAFHLINAGWNYDRVVQELGGPGDYRSSSFVIVENPSSILTTRRADQHLGPFTTEYWYFDEGRGEVVIDRNREVHMKRWTPGPGAPSVWDRICKFVGL